MRSRSIDSAGSRQQLSQNVWKALCGLGQERRYPAGSRMLRQGDPGTHLLALTAGLVKVVRHEESGETTLLAFRGPGDLLGEVAVFDDRARIADVVALRPCRAVVLEAHRFQAFVEQHGLLMELMRQTLGRLRESDLRHAELMTLPLCARLARMLVRLADLTAPSPTVHTPLRLTGLTQGELAQAIGVTRNAVVSGLQQLREAGAVETARRSVTVQDMETLRLWAKPGASDEL
ncbi:MULTISPECIES: Crp/Fnr family transcriptional regulator [unclassified Streptomyces]|uniref:Crp/Fnr family transcriptional regulator n=1 Tax=unclassified Streptomyces TaxID=2593676 RepID=UPI00073C03DD|nr:Crp/Fnr family transcriptional regulator [Streptomyces sp. AVP053U2]ODA69844.1 cAMP receptor protein [Streptomyces sp. AVP053U2]